MESGTSMDKRRSNGIFALVIVAAVIAALIWFDNRSTDEPTTAFAPAQSTDESVAPPPDGAAATAETDVSAAPEVNEQATAGETGEASTAEAETAAAGVPAAGTSEAAPAGTDTAAAAPEAAAPSSAGAAATPGEEVDIALLDPGLGGDEPVPGEVIIEGPPPPLPNFDIVRVEPTGEAVIAGQADPKAIVELLDGPEPIATAEASDRGEWVIALEEPLPPGTHDLGVRMTSPDKTVAVLSDQRVTVSVPEEGDEVLVVLNSPNAPSQILQMPESPAAAGTETEVAAVAPDGEDAAAAGDAAPGTTTAATTEPPADAGAAGNAAVADASEAGAATTEAAGEATTDVAGAATTDAAGATGTEPAGDGSTDIAAAPAPGSESSADQATTADVAAAPEAESGSAASSEALTEVAAAPDAGTESPAATEAAGAEAAAADTTEAAPETDVAALPEEPAEPAAPPAPPPPVPAVVVAAVEADTDGTLYIAGTATTPETVRVYMDDDMLGDAKPSPSGTWLLETKRDLPAGTYTVRADQVGSDGTVVARSEVPFEREVEVATLTPTVVASSSEGAALSVAMPAMQTVIIKRGDNLWRIARSNWGKGIRWSTLYQANDDQIRNPDLIYPGQVFIVPKGDTSWTD